MGSLRPFVSTTFPILSFSDGNIEFDQGGSASLKPQYRKVDPELRALQEENARLKKIIGNQALELEFKTELLKKNEAYERRLKGS